MQPKGHRTRWIAPTRPDLRPHAGTTATRRLPDGPPGGTIVAGRRPCGGCPLGEPSIKYGGRTMPISDPIDRISISPATRVRSGDILSVSVTPTRRGDKSRILIDGMPCTTRYTQISGLIGWLPLLLSAIIVGGTVLPATYSRAATDVCAGRADGSFHGSWVYDDDNPCTEDICLGGEPVNVPKADGSFHGSWVYDDDNPCTEDICLGGEPRNIYVPRPPGSECATERLEEHHLRKCADIPNYGSCFSADPVTGWSTWQVMCNICAIAEYECSKRHGTAGGKTSADFRIARGCYKAGIPGVVPPAPGDGISPPYSNPFK
jgi:hypothetical protein